MVEGHEQVVCGQCSRRLLMLGALEPPPRERVFSILRFHSWKIFGQLILQLGPQV